MKVQLSFRYGDPVELQVMSHSAQPEVLRAPEGHEPLFVMRDMEDGEAPARARAQRGPA
jgi:hypothetical protein